MKQQPLRRHFPYAHPVFGRGAISVNDSKWKNSVYYWWWAFLRCNEGYLQTCASGGVGTFHDLYKHFGDVRSDDFKAWWTNAERGARLFAEPRAEDMVRVLKEGDAVLNTSEAITISLPLAYPKKLLEKRVREILSEHHKGMRGKQNAKNSKAQFQVQGQPNVPALRICFDVWMMKKSEPDLKLWEIGNRVKGLREKGKITGNPNSHENAQKKRVMAATVRRYLKRAETSIERAGRGLFP